MNLIVLFIVAFVTLVSAETASYIPKSYYIIDEHGHKSEVILLSPRLKRQIYEHLHSRHKRAVSGAGSGSYAGSYGPIAPPIYLGNIGFPNFPPFPNFFPTPCADNGVDNGYAPNFGSPTNNDGTYGTVNTIPASNYPGISKSGSIPDVSGISVKTGAQGPQGSFSSSSTSINSDGKATYSLQSGQF